ncbi:hypothetical protein BJX70DRAFT_411138 [Aspergillus crustosus]
MSSRRRNGQPASCEPCRKDKVRCDHGIPVCGRCQKRNTTSSFLISTKQRRQRETPNPISPTPSSLETPIRSPATDQSHSQVYFGPTSVGFYKVTQAAIVPSFFMNNFVVGLQGLVERGESPQSLHKKTTQILEQTVPRFHVSPDVKGRDFPKLVTGTGLRLEIVGIVFTMAARASFFGFAYDKFPGTAGAASAARMDFAQKMLAASEKAIQVCKMLTPVNDLMIWLLYENWIVACMVDGDSSSSRWHRLGEVSNYVFELGLHRECSSYVDKVPIFLREIRRKVFASVYHSDKSIATFFGRPLRVSWRHSDTNPPLNISEEAMLGDEEELEQAFGELDCEGWNTHPSLREEILELSMRLRSPETADKLRDDARHCTETWNSIPAHLRYSPDCWDDDRHLAIRIMILVCYFLYLYSNFLIQRLLAHLDPSTESALLNTSSEILSVVLLSGRQQEPNINVQRDLNTTIALYGFSSASILLKALQIELRTGNPIPYTGSRAEPIRNLSVFISQLEPMAHPSTSNVNHALFKRASQLFSEILDEVLNSPTSSGLDLNIYILEQAINLNGLQTFGTIYLYGEIIPAANHP